MSSTVAAFKALLTIVDMSIFDDGVTVTLGAIRHVNDSANGDDTYYLSIITCLGLPFIFGLNPLTELGVKLTRVEGLP